MRRMTVLLATIALVAVGVLAAPAGAAPNNKNIGPTFPMTCGYPINAQVWVIITPGGPGISAWNVNTGQHYVAKSFSDESMIEVTAINGAPTDYSGTLEDERDFGAKAPAKGRTLVECTSYEEGDLADLGAIDADTADYLNYFFDTDVFAPGQELMGTYSDDFVAQVLVPGKE